MREGGEHTGTREPVDPKRSTVEGLDLRQGEVGDVLADVGVHGIVGEGRSGILALGLVDDLVVPDDGETVLGETDCGISSIPMQKRVLTVHLKSGHPGQQAPGEGRESTLHGLTASTPVTLEVKVLFVSPSLLDRRGGCLESEDGRGGEDGGEHLGGGRGVEEEKEEEAAEV